LTRAECHQIMCSGFATIAGSTLVAYISFGINAQALISSWCVPHFEGRGNVLMVV
jgi:CNT family concentrative nucleoside transporter